MNWNLCKKLENWSVLREQILSLIQSSAHLTLKLPDQICNSPYCQSYNSYNVSSENLVLDQLIIPKLIFVFILITYLVDIVLIIIVGKNYAGCEIAPNTVANATKFFTLATKSWKLVGKLASRMFYHNLTKRYSELKRFAKINLQQTSLLSLFPKRSTCISIDN